MVGKLPISKIFVILVIVTVLAIWYLVSISRTTVPSFQQNFRSIELPSSRNQQKFVTNHKNILFGTPVFRNFSWYLSSENTLGPEFFESINCPITNCTLTNQRDYLNSLDQYDAVVYHVSEDWTDTDMPQGGRNPDQIYVFATREAPIFREQNLSYRRGFFNWSMTYQIDSDIQYFYALVIDAETNEVIAPADSVTWKSPDKSFYDEELLKIVEKKEKKAAWFVSHCKTFSKREKLVNRLSKQIPVDQYGQCGKLKCPRSSTSECNQMLSDDYKFYLSFENSLCTDYVTEKLYYSLRQWVIPVVFSGADYSKFAPPMSYIDANNFDNPEQLASYLLFLDNNPKEYIKYFWWKKHYNILQHPHPSHAAFCQLCLKLHNINFNTPIDRRQDVADWWHYHTCVDKPTRIRF